MIFFKVILKNNEIYDILLKIKIKLFRLVFAFRYYCEGNNLILLL